MQLQSRINSMKCLVGTRRSNCLNASPNALGLLMLPSLLPKKVQWHLLSRLLHRDLANEEHKTNVHLHYHIPYQRADAKLTDNDLKNCTGEQDQSWEGTRSFFNIVPDAADVFKPVDALTHKPFTASHFLHKKLRWMTLGGQYDWTKKEYPGGDPPAFPVDLANLIHGLFPEMSPQAAIVNIYTPGDTLSLHRDVSEDSDHGLVSISLGCDGIFIIGTEALAGNGSKTLVIRLRSGDAIYMSGASRYAWHGIPLVVPKTCPSELREWPAHPNGIDTADGRNSAEFNHWRDWMSSKRININVRQMANS